MKVYKVPEIRFKGFSADWEERELGEVANRYDNLRIPIAASERVFGSTPYYGANGIQGYVAGYTHKGEFVLVAEDGANDLKNYPVQYVNGEIWVNNHAHVLQGKSNIAENKYLKFAISQMNIEPYLVGGGRAKLNAEVMMKMPLKMPPELSEQISIGNFFKFIDNLIDFNQSKYSKLISIKSSMLEKMFPEEGENTPKIRFKEFTEPWELCNLTNKVEFFNGLTYSPNNIVKENGTLVLRSSNVKNGEVIDADNVYVDSSVVNSSNIKKGDIIMVVRNGSRSLIGKHAQVKSEMNNTVIGAFMTGIRSSNPEFINALFDTQAFDKEVGKNLGATINQITNGMFEQMEFMFPAPEEQIKIGEYFNNLDNIINLNQQKLEKLKNIKKSLLEKMFI